MELIAFVTLIAISAAIQLPSSNYLPRSNNYLPPNQASHGQVSHGQSSSSGHPSSNHLPSNQGGHGAGGRGNGNTRSQQDVEKYAVILQKDQAMTDDGFHYSYKTSNSIRVKVAGNTEESQGGFSYKGDDGKTYTVTFTAGEGGFQPQGAHLPVPPPTPAEILLALQKNEMDEAAGIFDDGKYHPDVHGGGHGTRNGGSSTGHVSGYSRHHY